MYSFGVSGCRWTFHVRLTFSLNCDCFGVEKLILTTIKQTTESRCNEEAKYMALHALVKI